MLRRLAPLVWIVLPCVLNAQTAHVRPVEVRGHFIGESTPELISHEPEVRQKLNACRQHPAKPDCDRLLAAVKRGQRAEVSTSSWTTFVLDGGKLVKLTTLVHEDPGAVKADLTQELGARCTEASFPMQNALGATWKDRLFVWDTPTIWASLREDNNPASQNHHFVLVVESRSEHTGEHMEAAK